MIFTTTGHSLILIKDSEAPRLLGWASRSLIILFRYMPLDPAYKAGLARHETGQNRFNDRFIGQWRI
jgi:hypothetical protein